MAASRYVCFARARTCPDVGQVPGNLVHSDNNRAVLDGLLREKAIKRVAHFGSGECPIRHVVRTLLTPLRWFETMAAPATPVLHRAPWAPLCQVPAPPPELPPERVSLCDFQFRANDVLLSTCGLQQPTVWDVRYHSARRL